VRTPLVVCVVLLALTGLTVGLSQVDLRGWNSPIALTIAAVQATLIALFLMHLRTSEPLARIVGVAALVWLGILLLGTLDDVVTRGWPGPRV
jgi:cytochrome c oxidase subunit IV